MKISHFMSEALFKASSGYYRTKNPIGKNSDFITAPEISQVFGELLAAYFLQIASATKAEIAFVEMGAGKGTLFFDILSSIKKLAAKNIPQAVDFLERTTFHIIEVGEVLRAVQQKTLADFSVSWHENFEDFLSCLSASLPSQLPLSPSRPPLPNSYPPLSPSHPSLSSSYLPLSPRRMTGSIAQQNLSLSFEQALATRWTPSCDGVTKEGTRMTREGVRVTRKGTSMAKEGVRMTKEGAKVTIDARESEREIFFLSNELFDCFAIDQFVLTEIGWRERIVADKKFTLAPFDKKTHEFVEKEIASLAPIGAVFEYSLQARNFVEQLCNALKKQGGIAINIDYGYIKNEFANTLQALKNHQKCDVLENVGETDITALVDFSALERIVKNCGLNSSLVSQKDFLVGLGIEERRKILLSRNPQNWSEINSAIDRLIASDQMGDLFKCLIIW